ncbi:MAG: hypothetical protein H6729_11490 [Deltaproteobacteria bacterium]|nr:hypothetical protein [Deltaproteobacteria bacterium]
MSMNVLAVIVSVVGAVAFYSAGYWAARGRAARDLTDLRDRAAHEAATTSVEGVDGLRNKVGELMELLEIEKARTRELEARIPGAKGPKFPVHQKFAD